MDAAAFRMANALVGNAENAAGLEVTLSGSPDTCCGARAAQTAVEPASHVLPMNRQRRTLQEGEGAS